MSDKKYKVIVSDRTKRMLGTHIRFMAQVNKDAAKTKKQELMEAMRSLERMPQRFPFFEEAYMPTNKYHKMFVEKQYLIIYMIQDDIVYPVEVDRLTLAKIESTDKQITDEQLQNYLLEWKIINNQ